MNEENLGTIVSIRGDVVEVSFTGLKPNRHELLEVVDNPAVKLEVYSSTNSEIIYCLCFSDTGKLLRGGKVRRLFETLSVPVGKELLGRVVDLFGNPQDNLGPVKGSVFRSIYSQPSKLSVREVKRELLETGIKVVDFLDRKSTRLNSSHRQI